MNIRAIVPARNAGDWIGLCIGALKDAGFKDTEIIVVDDGSTDATAQKAWDAGAQVISNSESRGAAAARNQGAQVSGPGDILLFVDADVAVHKDARHRLETFFKGHPDHVGVFGTYDANPASPEAVSRTRNLLHRFVHLENAGDVVSFWTGCGAVRAEAFETLGGFDATQEMMEDIEFGIRLADRGRIRLDPDLQGRHFKRWTLAGIARTDLLHRALPWARLQQRQKGDLQGGFGINTRARFSVLAVAFALLGLSLTVFTPPVGLAILGFGLMAIAALNAGFLAFMYRIDGALALPPAYVVLLVHYFCGGFGFAWVFSGLDKVFSRKG